ncbi:MAG: M20/M25/M40 family metallo-hydrolase [Christensenellales bacterium]
MKKHWTKFFIVIMVCAGLLLGAWQTLPPDAPKGLDETPITLSEASPAPDLRMMLSHLRAMTGAPRPLGSEALADAQQYITDQLTQMGAEYEVHRYELGIKPGNALSLNNIIVTVKGKNPDEAVLFVAHTDSVSTGPGAFDDMVSVTALLEAIRALAGQTPARDIVFVLTDGEELGMWGAMRYVKDHPEMKEKTRLVVNLDARGNAGSMMLFETSGNNLGLLRAYQRAARHPYGLSLAQPVFRMMQNGTDLTSFLNAGYPGINLAVLNNALVYHTPQDNYETFSRASA